MGYVHTGFGAAPLSTSIESTVGSALLQEASVPSPASPFLALAGTVSEFLAKFGVGSGCGQTCVLSGQYANQAENLLKQNIAIYFSLPSPRTRSQQQAGEQNFMTIWNDLSQQCSNPQLGNAGQACISDRQDGACKWTATAPEYPGEPEAGTCWNWWAAYYWPLVNDPVVDDSASAIFSGGSAGSTGSPGATTSSGLSPLALLALVGAGAALIWGLS